MDRVSSIYLNEDISEHHERISFPTGITPLYRLERGHKLELITKAFGLEKLGLQTQPVSLQLLSIDFDRISGSQKSPYAFCSNALEAYHNLINVAYKRKAHYITNDTVLQLPVDEIRKLYMFLLAPADFRYDECHSFANVNGTVAIKSESDSKIAYVLGGTALKRPLPLSCYLSKFLSAADCYLEEVTEMIYREYGFDIDQIGSLPIFEFSRAANLSKEAGKMLDIPRNMLIPTRLAFNSNTFKTLRTIGAEDAFQTIAIDVTHIDGQTAFVGAVGFPGGGVDALIKLYQRLIIQKVWRGRVTNATPLYGFYPNYLSSYSPISLSWQTSPQFHSQFTPDFLNTYNGPGGIGSSQPLQFVAMLCHNPGYQFA